jgi:ATPase family AAA domain-containing protein 3A/B
MLGTAVARWRASTGAGAAIAAAAALAAAPSVATPAACAAGAAGASPSTSSAAGFDPEALERGAKALREINNSPNAKQVRETESEGVTARAGVADAG